MDKQFKAAVEEPFVFLIAEKIAHLIVSAPEDGASSENDTKDPYSDNSDTV